MKKTTTNKLAGTLLALGFGESRMKHSTHLLAGLAALAVAGSASAGVTVVGSDIDVGSGWRSGAVPSDIDGNGVLGSDGYAFVRGPLEIVNPSYGTLSGLGTSVYNGNARYSLVDDPLTTPGGAPTTVRSGTWNPGGVDTNIARLTLNRDLLASETIRVGLMVDNLDNVKWNAQSIRVADSSGGDSGQITLADPTENQVPDWYYFDITGLSNGATVDFYATRGINGGATIGAVSLDSVVSESPGPPEIVPPTSPADEASGVVVSSDLVATYDENIALVSGGTITIRYLGTKPGVTDEVITIPAPPSSSSQLSVSGSVLTIDPAADLEADDNYAVQISADAVEDLEVPANAFAGILDDTTWNFQTAADGTAPTIVPPTSPADEASDVAVDTNLVATFDETIVAASGNITIKNITEGTDTVIPVGDAQVGVSGMVLTIDPATDLDPGDDYAIRIDAGAVTDTTGNPFAGIGDDTTWNFTTAADTTGPTLVLPTIPEDEATGVTASSLVATFDEPIMATAPTVLHNWDFESDDGGFTLRAAGGGFTPEGSAWEHGTPDSFSPGGTIDSGNGAASGEGNCWGTKLGAYDGGAGDPGYYASGTTSETITCLRSPIIDLTGVSGAELTFAEAWDLASGDTAVVNLIDDTTDTVIEPAIYTRADGSGGWTGVAAINLAAGVGQQVRIEWCLTGKGGGSYDYLGWYIDDVQVSTTSADTNITIKNLTAATETTVAISDSSQVSIAGNVLTVTPDTPFAWNSDYAIQIGASAITDVYGNPFEGINDDTTWNFATETAVPIAIGTKIGLAPGPTPTDDAGNDWFDFAATGTYNAIHNLDGVIVDGVSIQVAGSVGFNLAGENNWVGLSTNGGSAPAEFVDSVTTDLLWNNVTITITGLDTGLTYDIYTVSHGGGAGYDAVEDTHTITGDVSYGSSTHSRGDARLNGAFHTFLGVSPDVTGQIVLATTQPAGTNAAFNGLLLEAKDPTAAGYAGWAGLFAGFTNTDPDTDFEGDGLASGVEWVVDGDPTANDAPSVAPTFDNTTDPDDFLFTFRRRDDAAADPNTTIVVEYGSDLTGWSPAEAGWITVGDDGFGTSAIDGVGVDKVTVAIPRALAVGGKLFARLSVTVAP